MSGKSTLLNANLHKITEGILDKNTQTEVWPKSLIQNNTGDKVFNRT